MAMMSAVLFCMWLLYNGQYDLPKQFTIILDNALDKISLKALIHNFTYYLHFKHI